MSSETSQFAKFSQIMQRHILWFLICSYILAALFPGPGLWIKDLSLGNIRVFHETTKLSASLCMLALLLFVAGTEVDGTNGT